MRILIVDDDPIVVESLVTILGAERDIEVVATAASGPEAVARSLELSPDIVLLDVRMPKGDGLSAGEAIMAADPAARIVYLTTFADDDYIVRALRLGARGYLIKQEARAIAPALREVMAGHVMLAGEIADLTGGPGEAGDSRGTGDSQRASEASGTDALLDPPTPLTSRERAIISLIAEGADNRDIASELHLSEGTVRNHISMVLAKLGLRNRTQIAVWAWRRKTREGPHSQVDARGG